MTSKLKNAREMAGYTIDDISDKLNIRKQYLLALEEENYGNIPGKIYVDGYIRIYSKFLGIDIESQAVINESCASNPQGQENVHKWYTKYLSIASAVMLILVFVVYHGIIAPGY